MTTITLEPTTTEFTLPSLRTGHRSLPKPMNHEKLSQELLPGKIQAALQHLVTLRTLVQMDCGNGELVKEGNLNGYALAEYPPAMRVLSELTPLPEWLNIEAALAHEEFPLIIVEGQSRLYITTAHYLVIEELTPF